MVRIWRAAQQSSEPSWTGRPTTGPWKMTESLWQSRYPGRIHKNQHLEFATSRFLWSKDVGPFSNWFWPGLLHLNHHQQPID